MKGVTLTLAAVLITGAAQGVSAAQMPERGTVDGFGTANVEALPSAMQMSVRLESKAENLDKALADIQKQVEDVQAKVRALKPVEGSLLVEGPRIAGTEGFREERMTRLMQRRFSDKPEAKKDEKKEIALTADVIAQWRLAGADLVALLRETQKLQEEIQKALPEPPKKAEATSEEEEERRLMAIADAGEQAMAAGVPVFAYVAHLPADKLAEARRSAFGKARDQAQATAAAAGEKMGRLAQLDAGVHNGDVEYRYGYENAYMSRFFAGVGMTPPDESEQRVMALGKVTFAVSVTAAFYLAPGE